MTEVDLKKLLDECSKSNKKLEVKEVSYLITASITTLYEEGTMLKDIEKKLGKEEFNKFLSSLITTLLSNIYVNAK